MRADSLTIPSAGFIRKKKKKFHSHKMLGSVSIEILHSSERILLLGNSVTVSLN